MSRTPVHGVHFTKYGWIVCIWALLIPFQYGYHISVLNQIQAVLTCKVVHPTATVPVPNCIPMSDFAFSFVTSIFTVGGLAGSLVANIVMDYYGRRGTNRICAFLLLLGTAVMGLSNSLFFLLFGRLLIGVGSGLGLCVGPVYLAEIAPSSISSSVAVLTQLSIVFGIMLTQLIGFNLATPSLWRFVFLISFALAALQIITSSAIVESPAFLLGKSRLDEHKTSAQRIWGTSIPASPTEEALLGDADHSRESREPPVSVPQAFRRKELWRPLLVVCFAMLSQQISGINAVLSYSNDILSASMPELGPYVSLFITVINVIMTFPPIVLIERLGRKRLLLISIYGAWTSLVVLGYGLNAGATTLSSIAIVVFVMSFAVGLGPVPFVLISEVAPPYAVSALSSVALSLNWIANFLVASAFLPMRNVLAGGDKWKEGRVFYVFAVLFGLSTFSLFRVYRG